MSSHLIVTLCKIFFIDIFFAWHVNYVIAVEKAIQYSQRVKSLLVSLKMLLFLLVFICVFGYIYCVNINIIVIHSLIPFHHKYFGDTIFQSRVINLKNLVFRTIIYNNNGLLLQINIYPFK